MKSGIHYGDSILCSCTNLPYMATVINEIG